MFTSVVVVLLLTTLSVADDVQYPQHPFRVVCFMTFKDSNFTVSDAQPALPMCTHLVYNYIYITSFNSTVHSRNRARDFGEGGIKRMVAFKKQFPYLKTMIGVGGPGDYAYYYSWMASQPENRATFLDSVVTFLLDHGLDGMDFDWRDPGFEDPGDKVNFVQVVKELRQQFDKHSLILSLTLTGTVSETYRGIDPKALSKHTHFLNLRTFSFKQRGRAGSVIPISPVRSQDGLNVRDSLTFYHESGVSFDKINFGMSSDYLVYVLPNANATGNILGSPIRSSTPISLYEFCKLKEEEEGWVVEWDLYSLTPYSRNGDRVVSHENYRSIGSKVLDAVRYREGLGGIAYYGLEGDDFKGDCLTSGGTYPMLRAIDRVMIYYTDRSYGFLTHMGNKRARYWWNLANNILLREEDAEFDS